MLFEQLTHLLTIADYHGCSNVDFRFKKNSLQLVLVGQVNNKNILNSRTKSNMKMCNSSYEVKAVEQETVIFRKEKNSKINLNIYEFQIE